MGKNATHLIDTTKQLRHVNVLNKKIVIQNNDKDPFGINST